MNEARAGQTPSFLFDGTQSRHQGSIEAHALQSSQRFDQFVAKEKELWDMLYSS
jgi:hypothetical protein